MIIDKRSVRHSFYVDWVKRFRKSDRNLDEIPFGLLITGDEETGGDQGVGHVLPRIRTDFCIALDGGNPDKIVIGVQTEIKPSILNMNILR